MVWLILEMKSFCYKHLLSAGLPRGDKFVGDSLEEQHNAKVLKPRHSIRKAELLGVSRSSLKPKS